MNVHLENKAKTNVKNTPSAYQYLFFLAKSVKNGYGRGQIIGLIGKSEKSIIFF